MGKEVLAEAIPLATTDKPWGMRLTTTDGHRIMVASATRK